MSQFIATVICEPLLHRCGTEIEHKDIKLRPGYLIEERTDYSTNYCPHCEVYIAPGEKGQESKNPDDIARIVEALILENRKSRK